MEPRIQFAQTADGVSIAFWTLGEGMPFVHMPWIPWSHIHLSWQHPRTRRWYQLLSEKRKVVAYDGRGTGLSERDVSDFSLEANVLDLEAVVDRLRLERFALFGFGESGPVAIAYAARHAERVSHLVLWCAWARGSDITKGARGQAIAALRQSGDWELYIETLASISLGRLPEERAERAVAFMRQCASPQTVQAASQAIEGFDVAELLPQVTAATLVLHPQRESWFQADVPRSLASRIPDARLVVIEGVPPRPYFGNVEAVVTAIDEFLGEGEEAAAPAAPSGLVTILFTDIEGSTALTQRLGDAKAQEVLRTHNRIVRDALKAHSGSEIKHTGDGIMASFASASRALECAISIQRALAQHNESAEEPLRVRIGLNAGEPVAEEEDLFGTAVQLAARIAAKAEGEEILVSDTLRGLVAGKGFLFADRGDVALRGFEDPVRLYEVRWREDPD